MKRYYSQLVILSAWMTIGLATAYSQDASSEPHETHSHAHAAGAQVTKGPNGGTLQTVGQNRIETVLTPKGIWWMVYDQHGQVVQAPAATGKVTLKIGDSPKEYSYKLAALKNHGLGAPVDLSKVAGKTLHLDVKLEGVVTQTIRFHAMGQLDNGLSDTLLIGLQKTCPVSGQPLGSMGTPPKILLGDKPLFVCCAGCTPKVQANPKAYLTKYYSARGKEVRPGVFEATLADAAAISAQKKCPVMDEGLGGMGTPQKVNVQGKAVYICCAGCAKKLAAEPEKYLTKLAKTGVTPPDFQ